MSKLKNMRLVEIPRFRAVSSGARTLGEIFGGEGSFSSWADYGEIAVFKDTTAIDPVEHSADRLFKVGAVILIPCGNQEHSAMADIMETNPDNSPVSIDLQNVFHLD